MNLYFYDELGIFTHSEIASRDPLASKSKGKDVFLIPPKCTEVKPEFKDGFVPIWDGYQWCLIEDNRGEKYWLPEDKYDSEPREMTELGALPENAMLEPPEMTEEEIAQQIQQNFTDLIQTFLDSKAQELNYDSCLSVCSYVDTGVAKFDAEGKAFRSWRSAVWAKGYEILAQVQSGQREIPTEEELFAELPELVIEYDS